MRVAIVWGLPFGVAQVLLNLTFAPPEWRARLALHVVASTAASVLFIASIEHWLSSEDVNEPENCNSWILGSRPCAQANYAGPDAVSFAASEPWSASRTNRLDKSPAGYSLAGCSPAARLCGGPGRKISPSDPGCRPHIIIEVTLSASWRIRGAAALNICPNV